jgi:hypothetical protein
MDTSPVSPLGQVTGRSAGRDLRLDLFRGLALVFIFLDHIPSNAVNWLTIRNFGFSDATETFVFISGYSAMLAYGGRLERDGLTFTSARILKRCWQLYVAQLLLFMAYTAQVAYTAATFNNPMYSEEMRVAAFLDSPHVALLQAMLLRFRPTNMDILPLYIVLLAVFAVLVAALRRFPWWVLAASTALYVLANACDWNLGSWPEGNWFFNPYCWQLLFVLGAIFGAAHGRVPWWGRARRVKLVLIPLALAYLAFALLVVLSWHIQRLEAALPSSLLSLLYPINKTDLDPLRLVHFLALAYLVVLAVPANRRFLAWPVVAPLIRCGQHSLEIFCLGVFLSFTGHMVLGEISQGLAAQVAVSAGGVAIMAITAYYLSWYRSAERAAAAARANQRPAQPTRGSR